MAAMVGERRKFIPRYPGTKATPRYTDGVPMTGALIDLDNYAGNSVLALMVSVPGWGGTSAIWFVMDEASRTIFLADTDELHDLD